jgi:tetratricopeptide (TPR) repeat protein
LTVLDTAVMLDDTQWENAFFRATILDALGDEAGTRAAYEKYIKDVTPAIERGVALGLGMGMTPEQVQARLGAPTQSKLDTSGGMMFFNDHDVYVFFAPFEGRVVVEGWRTFPAGYPEVLRQLGGVFRTKPFIQLAQQSYKEAQATKNRAAYDRALGYFQMLTRFDPEVQGVASIIANIYNETGRADEAMRLLQAEIAANPKSPRAYLELGNLHVPAKRYQEAADAFAKVLELGLPETDNSVKLALFNLGAVYKNWGGDVQRTLSESVRDRSKITPAQAETYLKPLRESAKYFERLRAVSPEDIGVLAELANLYYVLGDDPKTTALVRQLEGYSDRHANSRAYWIAMSRLYAVVVGDETKSIAADKKAEAATEP